MNWISELYDLYEKNQNLAGTMEYKIRKNKDKEERIPMVLLPIYHTTVKAQITVTIDEEGQLLRAETVSEDDNLTIIPVTEKSASRTASKEPHPFCDNLKYLAGDYMNYLGTTEKGKDYTTYYGLYIETLEKWQSSEFTHPKVNALYCYLKKGTLLYDLIEYGILKLDEKGEISKTEKIQGLAQADAFVRFRIESLLDSQKGILTDDMGRFLPECWLDKTLQQSFIQYYNSWSMKQELCYLSGKIAPVSFLQPKKIRNEGDGAKLISANDDTNFTYRGRFCNKQEAFSIGYETSQKVHNALKWIIRKQGYNWEGLSVVVWESDLNPIPDVKEDTDDICDTYEEEVAGWGDKDEESQYIGTNESGANRFNTAMQGYGKNLSGMSQVVLLAFDAATTGRLAITEYQQFLSSNYIKNIKYWHESCYWLHTKYKDKQVYTYFGMAGIKDITEVLYGTEQNGAITLNGKTRMYAETCRRLLPCISNRRKIPLDMVNLAIQKASSPISYEKRYNWERVLSVACSFVKKQRAEKDKEVWTLALNTESKDRDYLYGRLLAVADRVEYSTFSKDDGSGKKTNAKRFMSAFSQRPFQTWQIIEEKMEPYLHKLTDKSRIFYEKLLDQIYDQFEEEDFQNNDKLGGLYLLGYHSQSYVFRNFVGKESKEEIVNE